MQARAALASDPRRRGLGPRRRHRSAALSRSICSASRRSRSACRGRTSSASRYQCARGTQPGRPERRPQPTRGTRRSDSAPARIQSGCRGTTAPRRPSRTRRNGADRPARYRDTSAPAGRTGCTERQHDEARRRPPSGDFVFPGSREGHACAVRGAAGPGYGDPAQGSKSERRGQGPAVCGPGHSVTSQRGHQPADDAFVAFWSVGRQAVFPEP